MWGLSSVADEMATGCCTYYLFCSKHISSSKVVGTCLELVTCNRGMEGLYWVLL